MLRTLRLSNLCKYLSITQPAMPPAISVHHRKALVTNPRLTYLSNGYFRRQFHIFPLLQKYNKQSSRDVDSDDDDEDEVFKDERDSKVVKKKVNSLRADLLLKAGLNMARNKVETFFYESKIRVNGRKLLKKSAQLNIGDEIDVVRGFSQSNPSHLVVSRVIILSANPRDDDALGVQLRRYKSLLIENYSGPNAYKSSDVSSH